MRSPDAHSTADWMPSRLTPGPRPFANKLVVQTIVQCDRRSGRVAGRQNLGHAIRTVAAGALECIDGQRSNEGATSSIRAMPT